MSLKEVLPQSIKIFLYEHRYILEETKKRHKNNFKKILVENSLTIDDKSNWIKKFNKATFSNKKIVNIAEEFMMSKIEIIKDIEVNNTDIVAICIEKNDLLKLKRFINHHRMLGINKFVILDNDSDDGTIEYLMKQDDVALLKTEIPYTSNRRVAWINRIIAHYGYNRWYYVADSDELLVYNNYENKNIRELIEYYEKNKIIRGRSILLDMYAKPEYYTSKNSEEYYEKCIYFDAATYEKNNDYRFDSYSGGPRARVFGISPCVTKYPLVYMRKKDLYINSHFLYPYKDNFKSECNLVLKHYKFLPNETKKMEKIIKDGNYFNGSIYYKHYMKTIRKNNKLNFFCESTEKYENSHSLEKIEIYKKIKW